MGEKRKTVYFSLDNKMDAEVYKFSKSINFTHEVKQFLAMRMKGVTLEEMISNGSGWGTLAVNLDTVQHNTAQR